MCFTEGIQTIFYKNRGIAIYVTILAIFTFGLMLLKFTKLEAVAYLVVTIGSLINLIQFERKFKNVTLGLVKIAYVVGMTIISLTLLFATPGNFGQREFRGNPQSIVLSFYPVAKKTDQVCKKLEKFLVSGDKISDFKSPPGMKVVFVPFLNQYLLTEEAGLQIRNFSNIEKVEPMNFPDSEAFVQHLNSANFTLYPDDAEKLKIFTEKHAGRQLLIELNGNPVSCPMIQAPITTGCFQLSFPEQLTDVLKKLESQPPTEKE